MLSESVGGSGCHICTAASTTWLSLWGNWSESSELRLSLSIYGDFCSRA